MLDENPDDTDLIEDAPETDAEEPVVDETPEAEAEELVVTIAGADEDEPDSPVIQTLRKVNRDHMKRIKELEAKVATPAPDVALGPEPKLQDFDYDEARLNVARDAWRDLKRAADIKANEATADRDRQDQEWNGKITAYRAGATQLGARDYEEAEDTVKAVLSGAQQGIIVHAAENAPLVVYALGKNPKKAAELAKITDPVLFAVAMTRLEMSMKVSGMKTTPAPEKRIAATPPKSQGASLQKLKEAAEESGNYTAYLAAKRAKAQNTG